MARPQTAPWRIVERVRMEFGEHCVEVEGDMACSGGELRMRMPWASSRLTPSAHVLLRVMFTELDSDWIEVRDSTGRCELGSLAYAFYHARKWITAAFVDAHPDLVWMHAAAVTRHDRTLLIAGRAGAGKSTLAVRLLQHAWSLLGDDAVAIQPDQRMVLPLPFCPEVRHVPARREDSWRGFLEQVKTPYALRRDQCVVQPVKLGAMVFPEYCRMTRPPVLCRLTAVRAIEKAATHCVNAAHRPVVLRTLWRLAQQVPCYALLYHDAAQTAVALNLQWPTLVAPARERPPRDGGAWRG